MVYRSRGNCLTFAVVACYWKTKAKFIQWDAQLAAAVPSNKNKTADWFAMLFGKPWDLMVQVDNHFQSPEPLCSHQQHSLNSFLGLLMFRSPWICLRDVKLSRPKVQIWNKRLCLVLLPMTALPYNAIFISDKAFLAGKGRWYVLVRFFAMNCNFRMQ